MRFNPDALDRYITGNYGEDQFRDGGDEMETDVWGGEHDDGEELLMTSEIRRFVESIARMNYDGEEGEDGEEFIMENDDAVSTLSELINIARELIGTMSEETTHAADEGMGRGGGAI